MITTNINPVNDILLAIAFVGGVFIYTRGRIPQQTIKNLQDLADSQTKSITELKEGRIEDAKVMARLEGQLALYKELPLRELANGIKNVVRISKDNADSNHKILNELKKSSIIAAEDRNVLISKKNV